MDILGAINVLAASDSEGMFNRGWDIIGNLKDWGLELVYNFITFLLQVVYSIEGAFYYLTGLNALRKGFDGNSGISGLLPSIDGAGNFSPGVLMGESSFQNAIFVMLIVGVVMALFFLIYGALKGAFNREGKTATMIKMSLANTLRAVIFLLFAPIVVMLVLGTITYCLGIIFTGLFSVLLGSDGSSSSSIAYNIYKACFLGGNGDLENFQNAVNAGKFNNFPEYFEHLNETKYYLNMQNDDICIVQYADQFSIIFFPLKDLVLNTNINFASRYSYGIGFVGGIFSLVALAILTIRAGERLFEILIDYFLCFPAISTMPIDNGQRLGQWSQLFLGRIVNFSGSVIAMAVYIFVLGLTPRILGQFESLNSVTAMFFRGIVLLVLIIQALANKQNAVYNQLLNGGVGLGAGLAIGAAASNIKNAVPNLSKGDSNNISGGDNASGKAESNPNTPIQPSNNENNSVNNEEIAVNQGKSPMQELKSNSDSALTKKEKAKNVAGTIFGTATKSAKNAISSSGSVTGKVIGGTVGFVGGLVGAGAGVTLAIGGKGAVKVGKSVWNNTKTLAKTSWSAVKNEREIRKETKNVKQDKDFKRWAEYEQKANHTSIRVINKEARYIAKENIANRKNGGNNNA